MCGGSGSMSDYGHKWTTSAMYIKKSAFFWGGGGLEGSGPQM